MHLVSKKKGHKSISKKVRCIIAPNNCPIASVRPKGYTNCSIGVEYSLPIITINKL